MIEVEEAERINTYLKGFGQNLSEQPFFRLVWSTDQLEKGWGDFSEYVGTIFLREVHECREVPKYWYITDRWILERWFPPEVIFNSEIPDSSNGSYEPLYVFDKAGAPLPLNFRVVEIIMDSLNNLSHSPDAIKSRKQEDDAKKEKLEQEYFDRVIPGSQLEMQLHWNEAVLVPSNYGDGTIKDDSIQPK